MQSQKTYPVIHDKTTVSALKIAGFRAQIRTDSDAVSLWLKKYSDTPHTFSSYRREVERFLLWIDDRKQKLEDISVEDVLLFYDFLSDPQPREKWCLEIELRKLPSGIDNPQFIASKKISHYLNNGVINPLWRPFVSGLGLASKKQAITILFGLGEFLATIKYLSINPFRAARTRRSKVFSEITRYLEKEELEKLMLDLEGMPEKTEIEFQRKERVIFVISILYLTGLRRNELSSMCWEDIRIRRGQYWLLICGKGQRQGSVPINESALVALNRYRKAMHQGDFDGDDIGPVLRNLAGNRGVSGQCVHSIITSTLRKFNDKRLAKVSAHWFRHTAASHMLDAGIPLATVRDNLRHSNISTTSIYIHTNSEKRHKETENHKFL